MLRVGNNHAAHNKSALQWAQSIYSHCTATAKQKATALQILIENWFRQITGPHANLLSIMCILLMIAFTLVHSFRPVPINSPIVHLRQQADVLHQSLDREQSQLPQCTAHIGHLTTTVASSNGENTQLAADQQLLELRNAHWDLVAEANVSGDHKEYSKSAAWRASITSIHSALLQTAPASDNGPLYEVTQILRSFHPGRALPCTNPTKLATVLQPAIDEGHLTQQQVDGLVEIARNGISATEFRDLPGPALDLSEGNTTDPDEEKILLDFYFRQAAKGRVLMLPQTDADYIDTLGSVVISPSFLAYAPGKDPRPILNLSSQNDGVNQRMDDLPPEEDGYTTIPKIAAKTVFKYIDMVQHPEKYGIKDVNDIDLAMFVADASDAFYRLPISPTLVGVQCARVAGYTIIPMCCTFGWKRSAEAFSHITASILAVHKSDLRKATTLNPAINTTLHSPAESGNCCSDSGTDTERNAWQVLSEDVYPDHIRSSDGHVDDFYSVALTSCEAAIGAASDLIYAITSHLGMDSVSAKKFAQSSFWSSLQKIIGAWFDVETFTVTMPQDKIQQVIDLLESPEFAPDKTHFTIDQCASLRGKLRWALYATKMGDSAALIGIEKLRLPNVSSKIRVQPVRHMGETQVQATMKFHNDLLTYKKLMYACRDNPRVASCSMASVLPLEQRLSIPGQSKWLVWLSGDFSKKAQSFGIEMWHPVLGEIRQYAVMSHPPEVLAEFARAAAGNATKGEAIVSSVLERQNKAMAEWQFRKLIAGRPCIVLEDNQGSVGCINKGYAHNVHMQAMQMASNLRQAIDEAPMEASYCQTENMGIYDKTSRLDTNFVKKMNYTLKQHNMPLWQRVEACDEVKALSQWLAHSWDSPFPLLDELITSLGDVTAIPNLPPVSLHPEELLNPPDKSWQRRVVAAAVQIPDTLGSFGPMAYSVDHIHTETPQVAGCTLSWKQLRARNDRLATAPGYSLFDAYHGGGGGSVAAIMAGIFVKAGADIAEPEIHQFEQLTGRTSLGDVLSLVTDRIPNVHIWLSCSSCKDFCPLGSRRGSNGAKGGDHFIQQFVGAKAANARVVVIENVDGVSTLHDGTALRTLEKHAAECGFSRFYSKRVVFAEHGDPEHRARRIIVAFHDTVDLQAPWQFPKPDGSSTCAGDFLQPSHLVPSRFWDHRSWYRITKTWCRQAVDRIFTLGYKYGKDKLGNPAFPARVWHPSGLFPTVLASGNAGLIRWPRFKAMCPVRQAFCTWAKIPLKTDPAGCIHERRPMPSECLSAKGFPTDTPFISDSVGFRFAGNAVPPSYFEKLFLAVTNLLDGANESLDLPRKPEEYVTYCDQPLHSTDVTPTSFHKLAGKAKIKRGYHVCHNLNREGLIDVPVCAEELLKMSDQLERYACGRLNDDSKKQADLGWKHWLSFCARFKKPFFLKSETQEERAAAAAQAQLFLTYETACFNLKASSVAAKIWGVGVQHKAALRADPFSGNALVRTMLADAVALDEPQKQKIPVTNTTLQALRRTLNLNTRPGFTFWTAVRFAISFLCRISEYAFNDKYTVKWKYILFYTADSSPGGRRRINLTSAQQLSTIAEMQVIFFSDKTAKPGESKARSFWAIKDQTDSRCIVRDMARLWLISERNTEYDVFSWNNNTAGVTREMVNSRLKRAAIETGIPGADVSSHSLRATGLSRLLSAKPASGGPTGMQWEQAKKFGRWKSDCALRYFWASNDLAREYAASIWDAACFVRCRGNGDLQIATDFQPAGN